MNFINRALKNISRNITKTVLLIITFCLVGNFVIVGLGVEKASKQTKVALRKNMKAVITYGFDYDAIQRMLGKFEDEDDRNAQFRKLLQENALKLSEIIEISKDPRIKAIEVGRADIVKLANNTKALPGSAKYEAEAQKRKQQAESGREVDFSDTLSSNPEVFVKENAFPTNLALANGEIRIVEGSFYTQEDIDNVNAVAVVSKEFARLNGLSVGSSFYLTPSYIAYHKDNKVQLNDQETYGTITVKGIYEHNYKMGQNQNVDPTKNPDNTIYMPFGAVEYSCKDTINRLKVIQKEEYLINHPTNQNPLALEAFQPISKEMYKDAPIYQTNIALKDPLDLDGFVQTLKDSNRKARSIDAHNEEFEKFSNPLDTLTQFSSFIVSLVIFNALVIITLIIALTIKTRDYEIGVLLSMGASRLSIIAQFFVEIALTALIGISIAVVTGSLMAKKVGNEMLNLTLNYAEVKAENPEGPSSPFVYVDGYNPFQNNVENNFKISDVTDNYQVNISPILMVLLYLTGLGIVFVSVLIPSVMIMRYNPKKILMNTN